ncbi:hypothetical protein EI94DRAFT_1736039, partial [Lactarius quietus]
MGQGKRRFRRRTKYTTVGDTGLDACRYLILDFINRPLPVPHITDSLKPRSLSIDERWRS